MRVRVPPSPPLARFAKISMICLAVAQLGIFAMLLTRGDEYLATSATNDDTYYYLQTAWNTKELGS